MNHQQETSSKHRRNVFTPARMGGLFAVGALVLAACGGGGGQSAAGKMDGMPMAAPAGSAAQPSAPVATEEVQIKNFGFSPATITVKVGSTVVWTNKDSVQHDVTFDAGGIASSVLNSDDTFSHTFLIVGTYHYICTIHPFMHGIVTVTP